MTLGQVFSTNYLFNPMPPQESRFYLPLLIFFSILIILAFTVKFIPTKAEKIAGRYFPAFLMPGVIGLIYLFGRFERLPWLGSRFILAAALAIFFTWIIINSVWAIGFMPRYLQEQKGAERYRKYLPKPKKR